MVLGLIILISLHPYLFVVAMFRKPEIKHLLRCLQLAVLFIQLRLVALHLLYFWLFQQTLNSF
jgi:hypothetical protein